MEASKSEIFTHMEKKFLKNPKSIKINERGLYKKRIIERLDFLQEEELFYALSLLDFPKRKEMIKEFIINFTSYLRQGHKEELKLLNGLLKEIEKEKSDIKELNKKISEVTQTKLVFAEVIKLLKKKNLKNKNFKNELDKIINDIDFIRSRKVFRDLKFLTKTKKRVDFFIKINNGKKFHLSELINIIRNKSLLPNQISSWSKPEEYLIKQFFERGIILSEMTTYQDFKEICTNKILKINKIKANMFQFDIYPFKFKEVYKKENLKVWINPYYKDINFYLNSLFSF